MCMHGKTTKGKLDTENTMPQCTITLLAVCREAGIDVRSATKGQQVQQWSSLTAPQRPGHLGEEAEDQWRKIGEN